MTQDEFDARLLRTKIMLREFTRDSYARAVDWQLQMYRGQWDRGSKQSATYWVNKYARHVDELVGRP